MNKVKQEPLDDEITLRTSQPPPPPQQHRQRETLGLDIDWEQQQQYEQEQIQPMQPFPTVIEKGKGLLKQRPWKMATETLGQTEVLRKINTTLSFLDELGRAEIRLGEENISCELMQSVYIPRDVSPDLLVKFSERVTERGAELISLRVEHREEPIDEFMETVLTHCTNLVRVHLDEFPEIDNERILKKIVELPYLSDLEISGCKNIDNNLLYNIQKGLISLSLPRTNFTGECLVAFSFLGRLNISGCSDISTTNVIVSLSAYCLQLRELYMGNMKDFPEFGLQNIIRAQTWLRKLDISHCSRAVAVINGTKPPCLRSLNLAFCKELISAQDLINLSEYLSGISELTISGAKLENELRANMENCNWSMSIVNLDKSIPPAAEPKRQEEKPKKIVIEIDEVLRNTKTRSARHRRKDREKAVAENAGKKTTQVCIDDDELDDYL